MSSSGFDTGAGPYDKVAQSKGGEGLDIDAQTAGRTEALGEGIDAGAGIRDNIPGQGLDGGPGDEDVFAAKHGRGEGLDADDKGSYCPGGGVSSKQRFPVVLQHCADDHSRIIGGLTAIENYLVPCELEDQADFSTLCCPRTGGLWLTVFKF
ncbi:uncharacterized protein UBRO_20372 [Ustilago bromivora]|uniref:Uncharacterized protein n=1 Tax=Ustilago bromivora TaxID=307758 RepID=A0A1K0HD10_9BASI|nr:uncharacterized protein UBRO_20372 [Ustilago bromivora]